MSQTILPAAWDEEKEPRVLAYYEAQTEDDSLLEDEAGPRDLVPKVRELIAKHHS